MWAEEFPQCHKTNPIHINFGKKSCIAIEPLLKGHQISGHSYKAASNQSPDEGFPIVYNLINSPIYSLNGNKFQTF